MTKDDGTGGTGERKLTVAGWQNLVLALMGVVVLAGALMGWTLMNRTDDVSRELIDDIQPARVASYRLQTALRDQETAVRGYAIAADREFLTPYYDGLQAEKSASDAIRARLADRPDLLADLDAVETAAAQWRARFAEPVIASVQVGTARAVSPAVIERGKVEFDGIRQLSDAQTANLTAARDLGVANLDATRSWRDRVLLGMVVAFFVTAVLLAVLIRSAITRPLATLAAACRRITEGGFDERIVPRGPKDIRAIATDVENMRQRIVADLETSQTARSALAEQTLELQRSNAELEQFAYVASHDLQEPLRKVASFCQLLEKRYGDQLDERGVEYITFAVDGAKRMQVLINDLLTFSRVGRLNTTHGEVDLGVTLDAALANLSTAIEESGAEITTSGTLPTVIGDPTLFTMLWQNLIGNAMKFSREGVAPRIAIECEAVDDNWSFSLEDNGIGIAEEFVDKVFVIFQRLHGRDVYGGTGIGLALCKKIVEYHGGTIWIDTSYPAGTRFRFTLPNASAETAAESEEVPVAALEVTRE
ncbi:CHASE3 domain-containing protein [Mycolicibacterium sp. 624]|uniref:sensor histidine kinase n=1 Tax=Mycolicibacterium sp. 624 TaxID=3156314 RepID=UPI0033938FA8